MCCIVEVNRQKWSHSSRWQCTLNVLCHITSNCGSWSKKSWRMWISCGCTEVWQADTCHRDQRNEHLWSYHQKSQNVCSQTASANRHLVWINKESAYIFPAVHSYMIISIFTNEIKEVDAWIKRDQLDVTCFIISLFNAQHVSDVNTSILRSLRHICWVISWVVLLWFDVCWCYVVVWLGWCGIRMQADASARSQKTCASQQQNTDRLTNSEAKHCVLSKLFTYKAKILYWGRRLTPFFTFVSHLRDIVLRSNIFISPLSYPEQTILSSELYELPKTKGRHSMLITKATVYDAGYCNKRFHSHKPSFLCLHFKVHCHAWGLRNKL